MKKISAPSQENPSKNHIGKFFSEQFPICWEYGDLGLNAVWHAKVMTEITTKTGV